MSANKPRDRQNDFALPDGSAALLLPRQELAGCMVLGIVRDTRQKVLPFRDRYSHFPLSPYCSLTWYFKGCNHIIETKAEFADPTIARTLPELVVSGPNQSPVTLWAPESVFALTVGFYPDAWHALTGVSADRLRNQHLPASEVLGDEFTGLLTLLFDGGDAAAGFARLEDRITPLWNERRPRDGITPFWLSDWTRALALRAAGSGAGRSLRQAQRRIKNWTGRSQRELALLARNEHLFSRVMNQSEGQRDFAEIAYESGFADQAHMGREVRRMTGASPAEIVQMIDTEESYWAYRLIAKRFS